MANRASAMAQKRKRPDEAETAAGGAAMCVNGCGFFGAAATGNMCSKCYREHVTTTADADATDVTSVFAAAASTAPPEKKAKTCVSIASSDGAAAAAVDLSSSALRVTALEQPACAKPATAAANRCLTCRRKVGLTGFRCRCEGTFCSVHRYSDKHDCGYDYKSAGREQIAKQNPIVVADKIVRI